MNPFKTKSRKSSTSHRKTLSSSSDSGSDVAPSTPPSSVGSFDQPDTPANPCFSQLFTAAARFEKVLSCEGCKVKRSKISSANTENLDDFADLVGRDLTSDQKAITSRLAKLQVAGESWVPSESDDSDADSFLVESPASSAVTTPALEHAPQMARSETMDSENWRLPSEEVVKVLIEEFGSLTLEGEKEELILELDGALFVDVIIIGVIHVTTHRVSFHASLLSTRPDLMPKSQVLKSGSGMLHRKGFHTKKRIWMELSHDMLCTYASSSDEDRIRPMRSMLLSNIKSVVPIDPKHPRHVSLVFYNNDKPTGYVEFDTEESALDWRRELEGALYVYRHSRRAALRGSDAEESDGVRLSIPLHRINESAFRKVLNIKTMLELTVKLNEADAETVNYHDHEVEATQTIRISSVFGNDKWFKFPEYVAAAKRRTAGKEAELNSNVIVDFGPLSFADEGVKISNEEEDSKGSRIRQVLALGDEAELWVKRARVTRTVASSGYFIVSSNYVGFWSKSFTQNDTRYRIKMSHIKQATPFQNKLLAGYGLALQIEGHRDLRFAFKHSNVRDEAIERINAAASSMTLNKTTTHDSDSGFPSVFTSDQSATPEPLPTPSSIGPKTPTRSATGILSPVSRTLTMATSQQLPNIDVMLRFPKAINLPREILVKRDPLHFVCLTIGSRGDVQPYIALGLGLMKEGHSVTIVTHDEYKGWIEGHGIKHKQAGGDPGALMKLSVENKMFSPEFFKETLQNFRPWLDQLLLDAWESCQGADVLLESPSAMAGVHIAEALKIPYFRTFTMPWTKTTQFPHAFLSPPVESPTFNSGSYVLFDNVMWTATSGQINKWRKKTLKIESTDMGHLAQQKICFIYNFSPAVVPKPIDWADTIHISGYWFLDNPELNWSPPDTLVEWMAKARKDGKPIVYIGFGSITVPNPSKVTDHLVRAVLKSDVRAIISKGWSSRMSKIAEPEIEMPPECYQLDKVPHDWLFPQIDAAMHHGGAGTTGASLRAGIPTLIKPWFGDQFFWASRVQKLGAGMRVRSLRVNDIADALTKATSDRVMKEKAASVGERIRQEDGVNSAIHAIYTYLPRAQRARTSLK